MRVLYRYVRRRFPASEVFHRSCGTDIHLDKPNTERLPQQNTTSMPPLKLWHGFRYVLRSSQHRSEKGDEEGASFVRKASVNETGIDKVLKLQNKRSEGVETLASPLVDSIAAFDTCVTETLSC